MPKGYPKTVTGFLRTSVPFLLACSISFVFFSRLHIQQYDDAEIFEEPEKEQHSWSGSLRINQHDELVEQQHRDYETNPGRPSATNPIPPPLAPRELLDSWGRGSLIARLFEDEDIDLDWSRRMENRILDHLSTLQQRVMSSQVHCRRTICRVELLIDRPEELEDSGQRAANNEIRSAVWDAIRDEEDRWITPALASSELPLSEWILENGSPSRRMPGRARIWSGYVYDFLPVLNTGVSERSEVARETIQASVEEWLTKQDELPEID